MKYELDLELGGATVEQLDIAVAIDFHFSNGARLRTEAPIYLNLDDVFMETIEDSEPESLAPLLHLLHLEVLSAKVIRDGSIVIDFVDGTNFRVSPHDWEAWHFDGADGQRGYMCGPGGWIDSDWEWIHPEPFRFRWPFRRRTRHVTDQQD